MDTATVLLIAALVCFLLDAVGVNGRGVNFTSLGLALCVVSVLVPLL